MFAGGFVVIFADHDGDRYVDVDVRNENANNFTPELPPTFHTESTMAKGNDAADILAFANVQHAIGDLIQQAARETGVADKHAARMRLAIVDRIASGSPVEPAIALVTAVQEASTAAATKAKDPFPWQEDTRRLLLALGLGDHARPGSCHDVVVGEILPAINALVARATRSATGEGGETGRTLERNKGLESRADFRSGGGIGRD